MLEVLKKSMLFYKLATNLDDPEERKKTYDRDLASLPTASHTNYICEFIGWFYDDSFFEFDKVADILYNRVASTMVGIDNILDYLRRALGDALGNDSVAMTGFMSYAADKYLDLIKGNWGIDTYLGAIESNSDLLSEEVIRKYKSGIIKKVIDFANSTEDLGMRYSKQILSELLLRSQLFDKNFLEKLAKRLGPDYYANVMAKASGTSIDSEIMALRNKDSLNIFDMARIIKNYWNDFITKDVLEDLIHKADDKSKEYLRSLLYIPVDGPKAFFMLDEDMQPITEDYKNIPFPDTIFIAKWSAMSQQERDKWLKIFEAFKVVPRIT